MSENIIELNNAVIYQDETLVLNEVNLQVRAHELVYLVGKTGSGKSSLLKVLYGDLDIAGGTGVVCGFDLQNLSVNEIPFLRRKLGIVFQDFQLLTDRSVNENLLFVLRATGWNDKLKMDERAAEVLGMVNLSTKGFKMPHELSGGEQQRVVIARALLNHPELILADEPTGNLDPGNSDEILQLLVNISQQSGTAVLIASHDMMAINKVHGRMLVCENGRITESVHSAAESA